MKLYYSKGACSLASRIIINELGLQCEFEAVNLGTKQTETSKDFFAINAKGAVPTLITNNNETLTENAVILQYLADSNHAETLLPAVGQFSRYKVLESLNFVATELHKGFGPLFNPAFPQQVKDEFSIPLLKRKLELVNKKLENNKFICGDNFTIPDAYLFVILRWAMYFKLIANDLPHVSRYFNDIQAKQSVQQSLTEEGLN